MDPNYESTEAEANVFLGIIMEEGGPIELHAVPDQTVLINLMYDYRMTGEHIVHTGPRSRTIHSPYALLALSQLDAHVFEEGPQAEEAEVVPAEVEEEQANVIEKVEE